MAGKIGVQKARRKPSRTRKPAKVAEKRMHKEIEMEEQKETTATAVQEKLKAIENSPDVPVSEPASAQEVVDTLTDPRLCKDLKKYIDPTDVRDPSGDWVYGMIDPLHRDHVGLQYWEPITWDTVKKEGLEIPFNPMIRSSAEQKGDNLVRQGTLIYARVRRELAEQIRRANTEKAILKVKSVAPKKLAKELNAELTRKGLAKDYRMVVLGEDTILIGKR